MRGIAYRFMMRIKSVAHKARSAVRAAKNHPVISLLAIGAVICISGMITTAAVERHANSMAVARMGDLPHTTEFIVERDIKAGKVRVLINHTVDAGSFFLPNAKKLTEVQYKDGRKAVLDIGAFDNTNAEIRDLAGGYPIAVENGYNDQASNRIYAWMSNGMLIICLILILLCAQLLVSEVIAGHSFKPQKRDLNLRLDDVIGYHEIKKELREVIDKLENASSYASRGIIAPRGILLTGDPGVGKTMMAKAMSNEMGAEFFYCTGADFVEMYVGVGARRVRALFKRARQARVALIFIDEIDAIGSRNKFGNDSERQATINQLLAEMDGMNSNRRLLVMGATNNPELMDVALLRPGRFDKKIEVPLPDLETRQGILAHYLGKTPIAKDVDLSFLAQRTQGYSGAQLNALVAEAKNLGLRETNGGDFVIDQNMLSMAQEIAILGVSTQQADPHDIERIAVHELGHALIGHLFCETIHIEKVTLVGRGKALGYTLSRPTTERKIRTEKALRADVMMCLAGRAAEETILGDVSSGAADDLAKANEIVHTMVRSFGMGKTTGLQTHPHLAQGMKFPETVDQDVHQMLEQMYDATKKVIAEHEQWMRQKTEHLMKMRLLGHDVLFGDLSEKH